MPICSFCTLKRHWRVGLDSSAKTCSLHQLMWHGVHGVIDLLPWCQILSSCICGVSLLFNAKLPGAEMQLLMYSSHPSRSSICVSLDAQTFAAGRLFSALATDRLWPYENAASKAGVREETYRWCKAVSSICATSSSVSAACSLAWNLSALQSQHYALRILAKSHARHQLWPAKQSDRWLACKLRVYRLDMEDPDWRSASQLADMRAFRAAALDMQDNPNRLVIHSGYKGMLKG